MATCHHSTVQSTRNFSFNFFIEIAFQNVLLLFPCGLENIYLILIYYLFHNYLVLIWLFSLKLKGQTHVGISKPYLTEFNPPLFPSPLPSLSPASFSSSLLSKLNTNLARKPSTSGQGPSDTWGIVFCIPLLRALHKQRSAALRDVFCSQLHSAEALQLRAKSVTESKNKY